MSANFFDLQRYAATGITSPNMTDFDKMRARALFPQSYPSITVTGIPPLSFKANGQPLVSWIISGNSRQTETPTPDAQIMPTFCGKQVGTDWTIPITCGGQTTPVYFGQTQTTRRIKKLVLTGTEDGWRRTGIGCMGLIPDDLTLRGSMPICTHFAGSLVVSYSDLNDGECTASTATDEIGFNDRGHTTLDGWKQWLADQYSSGTPVTVWYVLRSQPQTGIVNEPLCKIGNYVDTVASTNTGAPSIPTVRGSNTLSVDTTVQPSSMTITGKIKEV